MAFKLKNFNVMPGSTGSAGIAVYVDAEDDKANITAGNYFNHNGVRAYIVRQRETASRGVPILIYGSDLFEGRILLMDADGDVTVAAGAPNTL